MCPLRLILIFLSATLAGFFMLRSLRTQPELNVVGKEEEEEEIVPKGEALPFTAKVGSAICSGFWTCVDMASGRYLWRHLAPASAQDNSEDVSKER